jgi:hypothetical protein
MSESPTRGPDAMNGGALPGARRPRSNVKYFRWSPAQCIEAHAETWVTATHHKPICISPWYRNHGVSRLSRAAQVHNSTWRLASGRGVARPTGIPAKPQPGVTAKPRSGPRIASSPRDCFAADRRSQPVPRSPAARRRRGGPTAMHCCGVSPSAVRSARCHGTTGADEGTQPRASAAKRLQKLQSPSKRSTHQYSSPPSDVGR